MKTKGAILWKPGSEWSVEEIEVGDPRWGEVTVQLAASGLCHSDEHLVTGATPLPFYPALGGHEGAGVARGQDVIPMCLLGTFSPYITVH